jgi:YidC/Oxa1 family membrane protein insertase
MSDGNQSQLFRRNSLVGACPDRLAISSMSSPKIEREREAAEALQAEQQGASPGAGTGDTPCSRARSAAPRPAVMQPFRVSIATQDAGLTLQEELTQIPPPSASTLRQSADRSTCTGARIDDRAAEGIPRND